jgi:hypothetical protein
MRYLMAMIAIIATVSSVRAQTFTEQDFLRQGKFCESATRLPWGDVNQDEYVDCMMHQGRLRSEEERKRNSEWPRTSWMRAYTASSIWASDEGCESWAKKQPLNPPQMDAPRLWKRNHAWNLCMERQGIFAQPTSRPPTPKEPDFQAMAAEQRTMTILDGIPAKPGQFQFFGCYTRERYDEVSKATGGVFFNLHKDEDIPKLRKMIEDSADCRFLKAGERVQVKAADRGMLCLSRAGSTDRCYWMLERAINKWE